MPGRFSDTREVIELAKVVRPFGGFYISHERSEGKDPMWKVASIPRRQSTCWQRSKRRLRSAGSRNPRRGVALEG